MTFMSQRKITIKGVSNAQKRGVLRWINIKGKAWAIKNHRVVYAELKSKNLVE